MKLFSTGFRKHSQAAKNTVNCKAVKELLRVVAHAQIFCFYSVERLLPSLSFLFSIKRYHHSLLMLSNSYFSNVHALHNFTFLLSLSWCFYRWSLNCVRFSVKGMWTSFLKFFFFQQETSHLRRLVPCSMVAIKALILLCEYAKKNKKIVFPLLLVVVF